MQRNDAIGYVVLLLVVLAIRALWRTIERNGSRDVWPAD